MDIFFCEDFFNWKSLPLSKFSEAVLKIVKRTKEFFREDFTFVALTIYIKRKIQSDNSKTSSLNLKICFSLKK